MTEKGKQIGEGTRFFNLGNSRKGEGERSVGRESEIDGKKEGIGKLDDDGEGKKGI